MSKPRIDPVVWRPPDAPTSSPSELPYLRTFPLPGEGPEDVLVDADGSVLTGLADGRIVRLNPGNSLVTVVADTNGRPLGLEWLPDGRLLVCDAEVGLLAIEINRDSELPASQHQPTTGLGRIETLVDRVDGRRIRLCNNAAVQSDGTIWFTDSSARFTLDHWKADILEHRGSGRLIRRDPDGTCTTVTAGLQFANGVALSPDESKVYFAETGGYSLNWVPTTGRNAGRRYPVNDNLAGFPDNLSTGSDGLIWIALPAPRNLLADRLAPLPPMLRRTIWRMPDAMHPQPEHTVRLLALDPVDDVFVHDLRGIHPEFSFCTSVRVSGNTVWLGSLVSSTIASFSIADLPEPSE